MGYLTFGKPLGKKKVKENLSHIGAFQDLSTEELAKIDPDMTKEDLEIINGIYAKTYIELSELAKDAGKENGSFSTIGIPESRRAFASSRAALALTLQKEIRKELPNLENLPVGINPTIFADIRNLFLRDEINENIYSHDNWAEEFSQKEDLLKANARLLALGWKGVKLEFASIINFINETPQAEALKVNLNKFDQNDEHWGEVWQQITEAIFNSSNLSDFYHTGSSQRSDLLYNMSMLAWTGNRLITENNMTEPGKNTLVRNLKNKKNLLDLVKEAMATKKPTQPQA